jgi:hypothetical protein
MLTLTLPTAVNLNASMRRSIVYDAMGPIWGEQLWLGGFLGFEPRVVKLKLTMG